MCGRDQVRFATGVAPTPHPPKSNLSAFTPVLIDVAQRGESDMGTATHPQTLAFERG
jgi:hypothetical protein